MGNDDIRDSQGDNTIFWGTGKDEIRATRSLLDDAGGDETIRCDIRTNTANMIVKGGNGGDHIHGYFRFSTTEISLDGDAGNYTIRGEGREIRSDTNFGSAGNDSVLAFCGSARVKGGSGNETLIGGSGTGTQCGQHHKIL